MTLGSEGSRQNVLILILVSLCIRLVFAASTGLGVDEAYTVATSRHLVLSTYDHPPLAWWLAWAAQEVFQTDAPLAVRLPFLLIFSAATVQMFRLGAILFGPRAGFYAASLLCLAPALGVTTGSWVLPDGPLTLCMLSASVCLARLFFVEGTRPVVWLAAGAWSGLALLSKYHGVFLIGGAGLFILASPAHRHWLARPWPYLAAALALAIFSPVIVWNAEHHWISFAFQSHRAVSKAVRLWMPFVTLAGQAIFLLPWIWFGLVWSIWIELRQRPVDPRSLFLICLGMGPVVLFTLISAWSHSLYFHWAMPGYLMLLPILGACLDRRQATRRSPPPLAKFSAGIVVTIVIGASLLSAMPLNWEAHGLRDPFADMRSWKEIRQILVREGLFKGPNIFVAATRWHEAGRLDEALRGAMQVTCLCDDARGYGIVAPLDRFVGQDAAILVDLRRAADFESEWSGRFERLIRLPDVTLHHARQPIETLAFFHGVKFRGAGNAQARSDPPPRIVITAGAFRTRTAKALSDD